MGGEAKPAVRQTPKGGATRCPYCHEGVEPEDAVHVCSVCLSRHHSTCWAEGQSVCASCGAGTALRHEEEPTPGFFARHKDTLKRWEQLRVVYNVVLFTATLTLAGAALFRPWIFMEAVVAALAANACFCLGPAAEVYLNSLGVKNKWLRSGLFLGGLFLSLQVVVMAALTLW